MTTSKLLLLAAAVIDRGWTKEVSARTASGNMTASYDPAAVRWCAMGACLKVIREHVPPEKRAEEEIAIIQRLAEYLGVNPISGVQTWNDHRTSKQEVSDAMRAAARGEVRV